MEILIIIAVIFGIVWGILLLVLPFHVNTIKSEALKQTKLLKKIAGDQ